MSPSFFKGFLLLGFLYLWMTPSEQAITIEQNPIPALINQQVSLNVNGVDPTTIDYCNWYKAKEPYLKHFIAGYVKNPTPRTFNGTENIAELHTNCTLTFRIFGRSLVAYYTVELLHGQTLEFATIILRGNNSCVASLSLFLLAAALFSSLGLL